MPQVSDSDVKKKKRSASGSALAKQLRLEKKRNLSLKTKQAKTLKLLKSAKSKLLKYQKAYQKLKDAGSSSSAADSKVTDKLRKDLSKAQERLSKTLTLYKDTKSELKSTKSELRKAKKAASTPSANPEALTEAQNKVLRLEKERGEQSQKLAALAESFAKLQDSGSRFKSEKEWQEAETKIASLEKTITQSEEAQKALQESLDQVKSQLAGREAEHEEALLKLWDLEEHIQQQGNDVSGALGAKEAAIEETKREVQKLKDKLAEEESEKEKALARLKESRDESARIEAERDAQSQELDESKERIGVLMTAGQSLKAQMAEQTKEFETFKAEHAARKEALERITAENKQLKEDAEASGDGTAREPAEKRASKAEARLKEMESQLVETRARLLSFHTEMEEVQQAEQAALERNQALEKEIEFRSSQLQQLEALISLLEQKEETHMRQLAAMRRQITELLEDNGRLKEEVNEKSGKLKTVERSFEETDESLVNIRRRYETTRDAFELSKSQLTEARNRALLNLTRAEEAEKKFSKADRDAKVVAEENKVLKRRMERLQERVAELEMLS